MKEPRYQIGQQFVRYSSKRKDIETIIDIHVTTSTLTGEVVKVRYAASHDFMGQSLVDYDICESTIARSIGRK